MARSRRAGAPPAHRSAHRVLATLTACAGATLATLTGGSPAVAHDGPAPPGVSDAAHAREDLVGTSVGTIERRTRAWARLLAARAPERRTSTPPAPEGDPGEVGAWSQVVDTPVVPVFQAVLPDGGVLMWDSVGDSGSQEGRHDHTRAMVWDPATDTADRVDLQGYNIFCAGYTQLPDGDVLVVGGNEDDAQHGIRQTHVFDWQTRTWSRGPDMDAERWYPSVAALADGSAVIVGGGPSTAEVYDDGVLRMLTGFAAWDARVYPFLVPRTDGKVELAGPGPLETMDTTGAGSRTSRPNDDYYREYGSFATYRPDLTLVAGGGTYDDDGVRQPPLATAKVVDTSTTPTTVRPAAPMAHPRRQFDLTVLPDGSVLATGGMSTNPDDTLGLVDTAHAVRAAERWDPAASSNGPGGLGAWTTLSSADRVREYHSSATLLPDGRVLTGGGGVCEVCVRAGYLEKNLEYFSPPYLFRHDGSGLPAPRPSLDAPATVAVGGRFRATSSVSDGVVRLTLVKLGAPTHGVDQGQRFVPLSFRRSGGTLDVAAPATSQIAPPGYYLLFGLDRDGVPSVASTVQVTPAAAPPVRSGNLARGRPAIATGSATGHPARAASDGRVQTWWQAPGRGRPAWRVDLGRARAVDEVTVVPRGRLRGYQVQVSRDGRAFTTVARTSTAPSGTRTSSFAVRPTRFVRVLAAPGAARRGFALAEVRVSGPA